MTIRWSDPSIARGYFDNPRAAEKIMVNRCLQFSRVIEESLKIKPFVTCATELLARGERRTMIRYEFI